MKLVKYDSNWADEMDIDGFDVFTDSKWEKYLKSFKDHFDKGDEYSYGIGTNEEIEYSSYDEFVRDFKVTEITDEEAATIEKHFGKHGYGFFPYEPYID